MDHTKRSFPSADDVALMSEVDKGWDDADTPATPNPAKAGKKAPPVRRDTDRHITIADVFTALGDTPYARQQRERAARKPVARAPFTLDPTPRQSATGGTEYRIIAHEDEAMPFPLVVRTGARRRDDSVDKAAE